MATISFMSCGLLGLVNHADHCLNLQARYSVYCPGTYGVTAENLSLGLGYGGIVVERLSSGESAPDEEPLDPAIK